MVRRTGKALYSPRGLDRRRESLSTTPPGQCGTNIPRLLQSKERRWPGILKHESRPQRTVEACHQAWSKGTRKRQEMSFSPRAPQRPYRSPVTKRQSEDGKETGAWLYKGKVKRQTSERGADHVVFVKRASVGPVVVREDKLWRCTHGANTKLPVHQRPAEEQQVAAADGRTRPKLEHCTVATILAASHETMWSCAPTSMLAGPASHTSTHSGRARADRSETGHRRVPTDNALQGPDTSRLQSSEFFLQLID